MINNTNIIGLTIAEMVEGIINEIAKENRYTGQNYGIVVDIQSNDNNTYNINLSMPKAINKYDWNYSGQDLTLDDIADQLYTYFVMTECE
jgi:hypothetical protein